MSREQTNVALCVILTTLAEVPSAPIGHIYAALNGRDPHVYTLDNYMLVLDILRAGDLATVTSETLTITSRGRAMAKLVTASRAS